MNKRVLIVVSVLAAVIVASIVVLAVPAALAPTINAASAPTSKPTPTQTALPTETPSPTATIAEGQYIAYSADELPAAEGRTFLFFYAPWCGQCVDIDEGILAQGVPDGITILKADFDSEQALEQQYGVTMRTTFVEVAADGSEIQRFVAYDTPTFDAVIAAMF